MPTKRHPLKLIKSVNNHDSDISFLRDQFHIHFMNSFCATKLAMLKGHGVEALRHNFLLCSMKKGLTHTQENTVIGIKCLLKIILNKLVKNGFSSPFKKVHIFEDLHF